MLIVHKGAVKVKIPRLSFTILPESLPTAWRRGFTISLFHYLFEK